MPDIAADIFAEGGGGGGLYQRMTPRKLCTYVYFVEGVRNVA